MLRLWALRRLLSFLFGVSLLIASFGLARAQTPSSNHPKISITPAIKDLDLKTGQTEASYKITIQNKASVPLKFTFKAIDFKSLDETGGLAFIGPVAKTPYKYGLAKWIKLNVADLTIPAGQQNSVNVVVQNLPDLAPGGHYAAVLIEANEVKTGTGTSAQVSLHQILSSSLFLRKIGGERYDLSLKSFRFSHHFWKLPGSVDLRLYNNGNMFVVPRGHVMLNQPGGQTGRDGIINNESVRVLPETYRRLTVPLKSVSSSWKPGRYTLKVQYHYDGLERTATKSVSFYYFPWQWIALTGVIILIVIFTIYKLVGRQRRRAKQRARAGIHKI